MTLYVPALWRAARHGAVETATRWAFERRLGIRTDGRIELAQFGLGGPERVPYHASPWLTLPRALRRSEVNAAEVFTDFGCGMGRMVIEAATWSRFARVVAVELAPERRDRPGQRRAHPPAPARPPGRDRVQRRARLPHPRRRHRGILLQPVRGPVFAHVVKGLLASVDRAPRQLRIVYHLPFEEPALLATGRVRLLHSGRALSGVRRRHGGLRVYEVDPG